MMLLTFNDYRLVAERIAEKLECPYAEIGVHRFPDGETRLTIPPRQSDHVVICRSLNDPNAKLIELLLAAKTAREMGATTLTLVAPYLCYMRQDIAFHPGEVVSQRIIGAWLAECFDRVITVEPHLHRTKNFTDAVPARDARALSAAAVIGAFLNAHAPGALLIGPDGESAQWVEAVAAHAHAKQWLVATKIRQGDTDVVVTLPAYDFTGRHVVLIDDIISSGGTLAAAARACAARGAARVDVIAVHALFGDDVTKRLEDAGIANVWSTDSVVHPSNRISLASLLAASLAP